MPNAARNGHELTEIREIFSHDSYKKRHIHAWGGGGISSKMNVPRKAAVEMILQLE